MSKVVEKIGGFVDKLMGSPTKKAEKRAERAAAEAERQAAQQKEEEKGVRASRVLAADAKARKKKGVGSASAILTGQSGPALPGS